MESNVFDFDLYLTSVVSLWNTHTSTNPTRSNNIKPDWSITFIKIHIKQWDIAGYVYMYVYNPAK